MQVLQITKTVHGEEKTCYWAAHPTKYVREGDNYIINLYCYTNTASALASESSAACCHQLVTVTGVESTFNPETYVSAEFVEGSTETTIGD